ncbi:DNA repair protein RadC [Bacteroidota bacterium]
MKINPVEYLSIPAWAEEDRPREKLMLKGKSTLTDAELLGILIGSGTRAKSAVDIGKLILQNANNSLNELAKKNVSELEKIKGIGKAKAITIVASLELGRRRKDAFDEKKPQIKSSEDIFQIMKSELLDLNHEEFWIIVLNRANYIIHKERISHGGISGTVADPKLIFKKGLESGGSFLVMIHNHPSGNLQPSEADIRLTRKLKEVGVYLELPVLDHIIFSDDAYFSFADEGML